MDAYAALVCAARKKASVFTFVIGLAVLLLGGYFYGKFCERVFHPDRRTTPAYAMADGVNYVPMKKWKNALIELLNSAGTGPVLGPIQGILFGPIAFVLIPVGCVLGGAVHDYFSGMLSLRNKGEQMPGLMKRFMGNGVFQVYNVFVCLLMFLVGVVFVYTPGDMLAGSVFGFTTSFTDASTGEPVPWTSLVPLLIIYAIILLYYLVATLFPIDKIIGRIYPVFGAVLLLSAVGIFVGLFADGGIFTLSEVWGPWPDWVNQGVIGQAFGCGWGNLVPMFFVTVACGIVSGFHSTQACIIARSVNSEFEGRNTFYMMMILEGFIAMIWQQPPWWCTPTAPPIRVSQAPPPWWASSRTASSATSAASWPSSAWWCSPSPRATPRCARFASCSPTTSISTSSNAPSASDWHSPNGFNVLWRYFSFANETCAVFAFALISVYLAGRRKPWIMTFIPGCFYMFVVSSYLLNARIGFNLDWTAAYIVAGILTVGYGALVLRAGFKRRRHIESGEIDPAADETPDDSAENETKAQTEKTAA